MNDLFRVFKVHDDITQACLEKISKDKRYAFSIGKLADKELIRQAINKEKEALRMRNMDEGLCWYETDSSVTSMRGKDVVDKWCSGISVYNGEEIPMTTTEMVRVVATQLNERIGMKHKGGCHNRSHYNLIKDGVNWHYYYYRPGNYDEGHMYDLESAYYSIYSRIRYWDIRYYPCEYLSVKSPVTIDEYTLLWLGLDKTKRNCLIGLCGTTHIQRYKPNGDIVTTPAYGCTNYQLVLLVLHVLQCVMWEYHQRYKDDIVYINTDGFIIRGKKPDDIAEIADKWGMRLKYKTSGAVSIKRIGAYLIGSLRSDLYDRYDMGDQEWLSHMHDIENVHAFLEKMYIPYFVKSNPNMLDMVTKLMYNNNGI